MASFSLPQAYRRAEGKRQWLRSGSLSGPLPVRPPYPLPHPSPQKHCWSALRCRVSNCYRCIFSSVEFIFLSNIESPG